MARFVGTVAVALLLVLQVSATPCNGGSCTEDHDVTSMVQVKKVLKSGGKPKQDPFDEVQDFDTDAVQGVGDVPQDVGDGERDGDMVNDVEVPDPVMESPDHSAPMEGVEAVESTYHSDPMEAAEDLHDEAIAPGFHVQEMSDAIHDTVLQDEAIADDIHNANRMEVLGQSVVPPPVGHGSMEDNPTVVDWKAETAVMPGQAGGAVVDAFDSALSSAVAPDRNIIVNAAKRGMDHADRAMEFDHEMADKIHADQDATAASFRDDGEKVLETLADSDAVDTAAIHTVQEARQQYEEAAIKKAQTEAAAVAGHEVGERIAVEDAADQINGMVNARTKAALKGEREELRLAREREIAEGITGADDAQAQYEADGRQYVAHVGKEHQAIRAHEARDAGMMREAIEGAQGIKTHIVKQAAVRQAAHFDKAAMDDQDDIDDTVVGGAGYVARDIIADAVAPQNVIADARIISPAAGMGDPDIMAGAIDNR